jgi:aerobic-type carbon monoxide dehydrogenase small subunit (CoxS/CutS family)
MTEFEPLSGSWPTATYALNVNDTTLLVDTGWLGESLLFALRERGGLTAAKDGCGQDGRGECGACTLFLDGEPTVSCLVPAVAAVGRAITTPEAFATVPPDPVASALADQAGPGCGFCLPGIAMSLRALLARSPQPSPAAIREALSGHQCRCLGIDRFLNTVTDLTRAQQAREEQVQARIQEERAQAQARALEDARARAQAQAQAQAQGQTRPARPRPSQPRPRPNQSQPGQYSSGQPQPGQPQSSQFLPGQPQSGQFRPEQPRPAQSYQAPFQQPQAQPTQSEYPQSEYPQPDYPQSQLPRPRQAPDREGAR